MPVNPEARNSGDPRQLPTQSAEDSEIIVYDAHYRWFLHYTAELTQEKTALGQEMVVLVEMTQNCIAENARIAQDKGEYQKRYNWLVDRYEKGKSHSLDEVTEAIRRAVSPE